MLLPLVNGQEKLATWMEQITPVSSAAYKYFKSATMNTENHTSSSYFSLQFILLLFDHLAMFAKYRQYPRSFGLSQSSQPFNNHAKIVHGKRSFYIDPAGSGGIKTMALQGMMSGGRSDRDAEFKKSHGADVDQVKQCNRRP